MKTPKVDVLAVMDQDRRLLSEALVAGDRAKELLRQHDGARAAVAELIALVQQMTPMADCLFSFAHMCNEKLASMGKGYEPEHFGYGGNDPIRTVAALNKKLNTALANIGPQS